MRFTQLASVASILLLAALPSLASPRVHRGPTPPRSFRARSAAKPKVVAANRAIDSERATQIQTALISSGYLTGTPSGLWDDTTQAAMQKLQADNGWQTKLIPDARAIIKLGLGPRSSSIASPPGADTRQTPDASISPIKSK